MSTSVVLIIAFFWFSSVNIDGVSYNKRELEKIIRIRNNSYEEANLAFNKETNSAFEIIFDSLFYDLININTNENNNIENDNIISPLLIAVNKYSNNTKEIDRQFLESLSDCISNNIFSYKSKEYNTFYDIFPPKADVIVSDNKIYYKTAANNLLPSINKLNNDFEELTSINIKNIIDSITRDFYIDDLSSYLNALSFLSDQSQNYFEILLSSCEVPDADNNNLNITQNIVLEFKPLPLRVYEANGKYYHSHAIDSIFEYFARIADDWDNFSDSFINEYIYIFQNNIDLILQGKPANPDIKSISNTSNYRFYKDIHSGKFTEFYISQCEISTNEKTVDFSRELNINIDSIIPVSLIKIDNNIYDKIIIDSLIKSMLEVSEKMIGSTKEIYIKAINRQTEIYNNNIEEYTDWYFSRGRNFDRLLNVIVDTITGERTPEEKYYIENFNRIMDKDTGIERILGKNINNIKYKIMRLFNEYLNIINYFLLDTDQIPEKTISKEEYLSFFSSEIIYYFDQLNETLAKAGSFYIQDYTSNEGYLVLFKQNTSSRSELKQKILERLNEIQERKIMAVKDPRNFIAKSLKIGSVLYVENYFVGFSTYQHYGVYIGNGKVIHYAPLEGQEISFENGIIHETTLESFLDGRAIRFAGNTEPAFTEEEIIQRARSRIGEKEYSLINNNCEHFARWCVTGNSVSYQVDNFRDRVNETRLRIEEGYDTVRQFFRMFNQGSR